jgi:hypothetical protein
MDDERMRFVDEVEGNDSDYFDRRFLAITPVLGREQEVCKAGLKR